MTQEQIKQAAKEYANVHYRLGPDDEPAALIAKYAFVAGAESRQAEIDQWERKWIDAVCMNDEARDLIIPQLEADIERYKQDIADGLKREEVARKVIEDKRAVVDELVYALDGALYAAIDSIYISREDYFELDRVLKKYSKKAKGENI